MNTPKPCDECIHLCWNVLTENDPKEKAECSLDLTMGDENCSEFEKTEPLGVNIKLFRDLPDKEHPGKTIGEVNKEKKHNISLKSLVEIKRTGVRLFVVCQSRDCDLTPLYWLSWDTNVKDFMRRIGGYSEDELEVIK